MALGALLGFEIPPLMLVAVALLVILVVARCTRAPANLPPFPVRGYPILGHLPYLATEPEKTIGEWHKKSGEIFSLYFGTTLVVVLNGYDLLKDTLVRQADIFTDRPPVGDYPVLPRCNGIIETSGDLWKEHRSLALNILRNFGIGKNIMAERVEEEIKVFLEELSRREQSPTDLKEITSRAVSNIICSFLLGRRFEYSDKDFKRFLDIIDVSIQEAAAGTLSTWFPLVKYIPGDPFRCQVLIDNEETFDKFATEMIQKVEDEESSGIDRENVIAHYLKAMRERTKQGKSTHLSMEGLFRVLTDFMTAGTETTTSTLLWFHLYMLYYPEAQTKIHEEIDQVIGSNRMPKITDKPNMNYITAAIMETQRITSVVPLGLFHGNNAEVTVRGYTIPKDTYIMPNLDSVLLSEDIWGDPLNFRPERFIDSEGNLLHPDELVPFSMGRRLCLGHALAKAELFLFVTHLYQRYKVAPAEPGKLPPQKSVLGITRAPVPYEIKLVRRDA